MLGPTYSDTSRKKNVAKRNGGLVGTGPGGEKFATKTTLVDPNVKAFIDRIWGKFLFGFNPGKTMIRCISHKCLGLLHVYKYKYIYTHIHVYMHIDLLVY